jgi:hypothetical protein
MKEFHCDRCDTTFEGYHRCPPRKECITCGAQFFWGSNRCNDCEKILSNFIKGQKKMKEDWDKGIRGGFHYT